MWNRNLLTAIVVIAAVLLVLVGYLFRRQTVDNPALGLITYHYQWNRQVKLTADTNRDGKIDVRARLDSIGDPEEFWEDSDFNGFMDRHIIMDGALIQRIELDEDEDGEYERRLEGTEAQNFYGEPDTNRPSDGLRRLAG
jgi:hypothetical protein